MNYDDLQRAVIDYLRRNDAWNRVVSLDIEASLETPYDPGRAMLSLSVARRGAGGIEVSNFIVKEETEEQEFEDIFSRFGPYCEQNRPLVLLGYGISDFDLPILSVKMRLLDERFRKDGKYLSGYWALRDTLRRAYIIDLIDPVRFEIAKVDRAPPHFLSLEAAIQHERFHGLPFRNAKHVVSDLMKERQLNKWEAIHYLWMNDRERFREYIEGDVYDTLLLAEELLLKA
ncbi:MAG: hypothetical protein JRN19_05695 [Nitrososphaerota archaeon]|nr:hypothetical protein [Nitrososphaerota archaeon]